MLLTASHTLTRRAYVLLALLCALIFLPGQAQLPAFDRDEARFAQATKQMIQSGDYVDIKFQNEHRYKKPIGIYWLQAAAVKITGAFFSNGPTDLWAYRLPSYLSAIGAVLLTAAIGSLLFNGTVGIMAALMLAGSLLLNIESRMAKTDATLLLCIMAAQFALLIVWQRRAKILGYSTLFWAALAAGALVKGPLILLPTLTTLIALCWRERSLQLFKNLQPVIGIPLLFVLIAPWFVAITLKTGGAFWAESVGHDMLGKVASGKESHGLPPGFYLLTFWAMFWPAAPFIAMAAPAIWQRRRDDALFALLAWALPTWLVFELVPTKLLHYTLPTYPALALLAAAAWHNGFTINRWWKYACWFGFGLVTLGMIGGFAALPYIADGTVVWPQIGVGALVALGLLVLRRSAQLQRVLMGTLLSALFLGTLLGITLPNWRYMWIAKQVDDVLRTQTQCAEPLLASAAYNEPSLVFHIGTPTLLDADGALAASYLASDPCQFALIDKANEEAFITQTAALKVIPFAIANIKGFSLGGGDAIDMVLYGKTDAR